MIWYDDPLYEADTQDWFDAWAEWAKRQEEAL